MLNIRVSLETLQSTGKVDASKNWVAVLTGCSLMSRLNRTSCHWMQPRCLSESLTGKARTTKMTGMRVKFHLHTRARGRRLEEKLSITE